GDLYGWRKATDGSWFLGLYVLTGRVKDTDGHTLKTALREVAEKFPNTGFNLSPNQNVVLTHVTDADQVAINALLASHGVKTENQASVLHSAALACPALPTCGLALAESERMLPGLIGRIEKLCAEAGLADEEIVIRSTGCPNGCARPYMAELAFVGKAPGRYQIWLGGDAGGNRMNRVWKDVVKEPDIENELRPVLQRFAQERNAGERFGDFCERVILNEPAAPLAEPVAAT
ncbi:MAG: sulfite reductase, partial [Verrucomicrobiota bacterium]